MPDGNPERSGPVAGSCFCGAVRFQLLLPTLFCLHCHCTMCRRSHGAGFVTWVGVSRGGFELTRGHDQLARHESSDHGSRSFCRVCGSSLFCESTQHPDQVDIVLANLAGRIDREPEMHIHYSDRADWVSTGDALPRLGGKSGLEPLDS